MLKQIEQIETNCINIIINNACQTVKQSKTLNHKIKMLESETKIFIENNNYDENNINKILIEQINSDTIIFNSKSCKIISSSEHIKKELNVFNDFKDDELRMTGLSWDKSIEDIDPTEIVEATLINQLVPTLIINSLKKKMIGSTPKFIINVTALEGQFDYKKKTDKHLHTNMCKAAMNMMIRTLCEDPDKDLHVYCIDPGYVSGVCPQLDNYPVSMHDGASRIVYPILRFFNNDPLPKEWVKMRNFDPVAW